MSVNISSSGISFFLNTFTGSSYFISIDLSQSKELSYLGKVSAAVVRIVVYSSEKLLVAAEFI
jgi:hypothetical protein